MKRIAKISILSVALFMGLISISKAFSRFQNTYYYTGNTTESNFFLSGQWQENGTPGPTCNAAENRPCQIVAASYTELQSILDGCHEDVDALFLISNSKP